MALTIDASSLVTISGADSTSGWSGPTLSTEDEITKENSLSLSSIVRNNGQQEYYTVSSQNYSSQHLRLWVSTGVYSKMVTTGKTGLRFYVEDTSNSGAFWNIADKSTYQGGWINIVVDTANPDSGSANMSAIDELGIVFGLTSSSKRVINTYVDYLRYGDGYTMYGTSWGFAEVSTADASSGFGIVNLYEGIYFTTGSLQIGRASEQTTFTENGSVISFVDAPVAATLFGITIIGHASSTFDFTGCVISSAGPKFYLDFDDTSIADLNFQGNTVQNANNINLRSSNTACIVNGNTFDTCDVIYINGCEFENNAINSTTETTYGSIHVTSATDIAYAKNLSFNSYGSNYAIYVDAGVTAITLDNYQFDNPDGAGSNYALYWAGTSGTLIVTAQNGTNLTSAGSTAASGGTVDVQVSATISLTGLVDNTEVRFYTSDLSTELYGEENSLGGTVSYTYSSTANDVIIQIYSIGYDTIRLTGINLNGINASIPIQQKVDRWYKNP